MYLVYDYTQLATNVIINRQDPTQNSGQTRMFYNAGQTRLTQAKHDPDEPTHFQP